MVRSMDDERARAVLIQMAQVWFRLAQDQPSVASVESDEIDRHY